MAAYQAEMPRLLCLEGLPDAFGTRLEKAAWKQPEPVSGLYRRYPKALDRDGFELCSVKARLL